MRSPPACSVVPWICLNALFRVLAPVAGWDQKHQQWSVSAPLRFVLCHICCAVGFSSNAGSYIQVSTVPWEDKHSLPDSALSTWCRSAAFLLEAALGPFPEFVLVYCFLSFNFQFIYVLYPLGILYMSIMCQDVSLMYLDVSIMCQNVCIMYQDMSILCQDITIILT